MINFLTGWEKIDNPPEWVSKAWQKKGRSYGAKTWTFIGKTFIYKIVVDMPKFMGDMPTRYYKKLKQ